MAKAISDTASLARPEPRSAGPFTLPRPASNRSVGSSRPAPDLTTLPALLRILPPSHTLTLGWNDPEADTEGHWWVTQYDETDNSIDTWTLGGELPPPAPTPPLDPSDPAGLWEACKAEARRLGYLGTTYRAVRYYGSYGGSSGRMVKGKTPHVMHYHMPGSRGYLAEDLPAMLADLRKLPTPTPSNVTPLRRVKGAAA